jgi:hypothetical protein
MPRPAPKYAPVLLLTRVALVEWHTHTTGGAAVRRGRSELTGGPAVFRFGTKQGSRS